MEFKKRIVSACLLGIALSGPAVALAQHQRLISNSQDRAADSEGIRLMNRFFNNVKTLQGDFSQTVENDKGHISKQSSGQVALSRPGKFRWIYNAPEPQEIVGDGQKLWVYDKDLDQVTVKPLNAALGSTPAALIAGRNVIRNTYKVNSLGQKNGLYWIELTPKTEDYGFNKVLMGFSNGGALLRAMQLSDNFGQTTRLSFNNLQANVALSPDKFNFQPPKGVDVLQQ